MTGNALDVARAYNDHWTNARYGEARALLSDDLEVEVPINQYSSADSFIAAVEGFASMVEAVTPLSELGNAQEAMLLYDLDLAGLGGMRIAEHFTISEGKIVRLRQIHDTAALRDAGFDRQASP